MSREVEQTLARARRDHYRELLAPSIRVLGRFDLAEEVVQDALLAAWQVWRRDGLPDQPLAWLKQVVRNRALDHARRNANWNRKAKLLEQELPSMVEMAYDDAPLQDDVLRLVFTCCHPSLAPEARVALTLRTVLGLSSDEVARAFLVKPATLQQRVVRAKRKIDQAGIPFEIPESDQLEARLSAVLRCIYLVFNAGYQPSDGPTVLRSEGCQEALRLGRLVCELRPDDASASALLALMMLHHARAQARVDETGELVSLERQDRSQWDHALIRLALPRVEAALKARPIPEYAIEAAIVALHARAPSAEATDWPQIAALYGELLRRSPAPNPVWELNASVARAFAGDLEGQLAVLEQLEASGRLANYHLLPAAVGELRARAGDEDGAREALERALDATRNTAEQRFIRRRLAELDAPS